MTTARPVSRVWLAGLALLLVALAAGPAGAQTISGLQWRNVGPFRAGRVSAVTGAVGEPGVFYAGFPTGGLWKTTNAGATWEPVFDAVTSVSSIGAVEVAPSDTSVIYVGTGDFPSGGNIDEGDGVYKSVDAGRTWRHIGLDSTRQIPSLLVDPRDPNLVLVAAQGDLHSRGGQRGLYRSTDGGTTWTRTLFVDEVTGIQKIAWAADQPSVVFLTTDRHYTAPVAPGRGGFGGGGAGGQGP
ncbi:MAG: WD40/YVTN/BNR-like repeat-containing protein, partial [Gemmatimonadales bacterium]